MSDRLMEEVNIVLGRGGDKPMPVQEGKDPAMVARNLIDTHANLDKMLQSKIDAVKAGFEHAKKSAKNLDKYGSGNIEAPTLLKGKPLAAAKALHKFAGQVVEQIEKVIKDADKGRGSMGFRRESVEAHLDFLDRRLDEIRTPKHDSSPDNAGVNDYSPELVAAAKSAADYLSTPGALKVGSTVHIGRKSLSVVGAPKMGDAGMLVTLAAPDSKDSYNQYGDGYTLLIPFQGDTSAPPAMTAPQMTVAPTAEATLTWGGRSTKILMADIRLEEGNYGDHMTNYGDYEPMMGKVNPGDKIKLTTPTVYRVVGKVNNAALVQPDAMDKEMYGKYRAAATGSPVDLWKPAGGWIDSGSDYAGRGGKEFKDTNPVTGMRVMKFNPHSGKFMMPTGRKPGEYELADKIQIVGHHPNETSVVGESMSLDRFQMTIAEAGGTSVVEKLESVANASSAMTVNGILFEPGVAQAILHMHSSLSEDRKERLAAMSADQVLETTMRMLGSDVQEGKPSKADWEKALKKDEAELAKMKKALKDLKAGRKIPNLTVDGAKTTIDGLELTIKNKKKHIAALSEGEDGEPLVFEFRNSRTAEKVADVLSEMDLPMSVEGAEIFVSGDADEVFEAVNGVGAYFTEKTFNVKKKVKNPGKFFKPEMFKKGGKDDKPASDDDKSDEK